MEPVEADRGLAMADRIGIKSTVETSRWHCLMQVTGTDSQECGAEGSIVLWAVGSGRRISSPSELDPSKDLKGQSSTTALRSS